MFEYPRASNRDFASPSVRAAVGLIDRDNGTVGDDRSVCARAKLAGNKPNIQIATKGGTRISVSPNERVNEGLLFFHRSSKAPIAQIVATVALGLIAAHALRRRTNLRRA